VANQKTLLKEKSERLQTQSKEKLNGREVISKTAFDKPDCLLLIFVLPFKNHWFLQFISGFLPLSFFPLPVLLAKQKLPVLLLLLNTHQSFTY